MKLRWLLIVTYLAVSMIPIGIIGGFQGFQFATMFLMGLILIATFCVSLIIIYFISRPLEKLTKNIDKISKGDLEVQLENSEIYEINALIQSLNRVMASLKLAIHKVGVKRGEIFDETVKAKEELEEKYRHLLSTINEWVWETDIHGCLMMCSPRITDLLGYKPEDVLGKPLENFLSSNESKKMTTILSQPEETTTGVCTIQSAYNHKDGRAITMVACITPRKDAAGRFIGYRGIQKTVTSPEEQVLTRKHQQPIPPPLIKKKPAQKKKHIARPSEEYDMDALLLCDEHSHIVDCTKAMYELLGYTREELLTLTLKDFDMLETSESIKEKFRDAKKHGSVLVKTIHKRKDGSSLLVRAQIDYLRDKNLYQCLITEEQPITGATQP
ncbi:MAG: PAS domain S-box protein [Methanobacteriota archaeon]